MRVDNSSSSKLQGRASLRRAVSMTRITPGQRADSVFPFIKYEHAEKDQVPRKAKNVVDERGFATFDAMHFGTAKTTKTRRRSKSTVDQRTLGLLADSHPGNSEATLSSLLPGALETTAATFASSESNQAEQTGHDSMSSPQDMYTCNSRWPENNTGLLSPFSLLHTFPPHDMLSGNGAWTKSLHLQMPSHGPGYHMNDQSSSPPFLTVPGTPLYPSPSSVSGSWMSEPSPSSYFSSTASTSPYSPLPTGMSPFRPPEDQSSWNAAAPPDGPDHGRRPVAAPGHYPDPHGLPDLKSERLPCGCFLITNPYNAHVGVVKSNQCWYVEHSKGSTVADSCLEGECQVPDGYRVPITSLQQPDLTQSMMHGNGADDGSQPSASNLSLNYALDQTA